MFTKKNAVIIPEEETSVWCCSSEHCTGWMRDNFTFQTTPNCPLCHSEMTIATKMLPIIPNYTRRVST